ncbi:MAG TPA: CGNR zinc finger domain-containing protein [Pseudonocardiaceae bacterium]|nr:CGNR zinc finger domain-containing protein [Pseudonocardiaceae bacterium]
MEFDSHTSGVVQATVGAINAVAPGWARGKQYRPPAGDELRDALITALNSGSRRVKADVSAAEVAELAGYLSELRVVFGLLDQEDLDGACELVNKILTETEATPMLSHHDGEPWHLHFHSRDASWAQGWAGSMATATAMVLGSSMADRLGLCSAPSCDRAYVDTSRNGARRFCSTACQNRVKAATFRERQRNAVT